MSIVVDGFFSADADAVAQEAVPLPAWRTLTRDLNRTVQRLFGETSIPFADHLSPPLIARMLLGRALSNFQGAVLLSERGMTVEARTLVRSCLETAFCLTAVLSKGQEFTERLVADAEKHRRMLVGNLLSSDIAGDLGADMESRLRSFLASIPADVEPKWLHASQMAEASPLRAMFVFYRELSGDAHPTVTSMERYFVEGGGSGRFRWGPELDADTVVATNFYACTFLIAAGVGFNSEVANSEAVEKELGAHWERLQELTAEAKVFHDADD